MTTYQPLHHKYRPQTFADLVGQEAIAATLTHAIQQQRIAPAYLFTGARGTGKTSSARILAKSLNCLKHETPTEKPCGKCEVCRAIANGSALDVIEIDAASNTGVDNIRELIERAQFAPVQCRYKVYVVDECHMLSAAAFNALLKTLEEPPDRVVFVLATTDPQRVLPTIISRCQRFDFRRIPLEAMVQHLQKIADIEKIAIDQDAVTLVAQISQGGLRDAESLLDQLSLLAEQVTVEKVWDLVGSVPERDLMGLLEAIAQDDPEALLNSTRRLMDRGREPLVVLQNLASFYRDLLIAKTAPSRSDLVALTASTWATLCDFAQNLEVATILAGQQHLRSCEVQLKSTTQPRLWLEITLMGLLPSAITTQPVEVSRDRIPALSRTSTRQTEHTAAIAAPTAPPTRTVPAAPVEKPAPVQPEPALSQPPEPEVEIVREPAPEPAIVEEIAAEADFPQPSTAQAGDSNLNQIWQQIIAHLHPLSKALLNEHGRLLAFDGQEARIGISSDKLVKIAQNQVKNIEKAFVEVFSQNVRVSLEVASSIATRGNAPPAPPSPDAGSFPEARSHPGLVSGNSKPTAPAKGASNRPQPPSSEGTSVKGGGSSTAPPTGAKKSVGKPEKTPGNSWEEDDAIKAAKQLADFFGGKVVSDGEESSTALESDTSELGKQAESIAQWSVDESEGVDDDVPF